MPFSNILFVFISTVDANELNSRTGRCSEHLQAGTPAAKRGIFGIVPVKAAASFQPSGAADRERSLKI